MDGIRHFLSLLRWQTTNNSFNTMHYFYFLNLRKGIRTFLFCFTSSEVWQHFAESLENLSREFGQHVDLCDESCSCCWRHLNLQTASYSLYFHIVIDDIDQKQQLYIAPQNTWNPQEEKMEKLCTSNREELFILKVIDGRHVDGEKSYLIIHNRSLTSLTS